MLKVKAVLDDKGISVAELSKMAKVNRTYVYDAVNGKAEANEDLAAIIAFNLGWPDERKMELFEEVNLSAGGARAATVEGGFPLFSARCAGYSVAVSVIGDVGAVPDFVAVSHDDWGRAVQFMPDGNVDVPVAETDAPDGIEAVKCGRCGWTSVYGVGNAMYHFDDDGESGKPAYCQHCGGKFMWGADAIEQAGA